MFLADVASASAALSLLLQAIKELRARLRTNPSIILFFIFILLFLEIHFSFKGLYQNLGERGNLFFKLLLAETGAFIIDFELE